MSEQPCAACGFFRSDHRYGGACYGICGEFVAHARGPGATEGKMKPGDIIFWEDKEHGHHRFYRVDGVHLGADGQTSVIEIDSLTERSANPHGFENVAMFVPEPLLRHVQVYTPVAPEAAP